MINIDAFVEKQNHESFYALVIYDGITDPTYFYTVDLGKEGLLNLHSPCEVFKRFEGIVEIENYFKWLMEKENGGHSEEDIDKYFRPLIVDDIYYEVENFQCTPYLPQEVDAVEICSERNCLLYILRNSKQ